MFSRVWFWILTCYLSQADEVEDEPDEYDCADPTSQPPSSPPTECSEEEVLEAADEDFNMETDYTQEESSAESLGSDEEGQDNSSSNTVTWVVF